MAERLTKKIVKTVQDKYSLGSYLYYDFAEIDDTNKLLNKLGKLEDILEKYGIESVEELSKIFSYLSGRFINSVYSLKHKFDSYEDRIKCLANKKGQYYEELYETKQDRDTWKRACELACDAMTKLGGDDCCGCRLDKKMCDICENKKALFDYFYQQAKKERDDDNR